MLAGISARSDARPIEPIQVAGYLRATQPCMLRIDVIRNGQRCLWLQGDLTGVWVDELRKQWQQETERQAGAVAVHLHDVGWVDEDGMKLLRDIHHRGDKLTGRGVMINYLIDQIVSG